MKSNSQLNQDLWVLNKLSYKKDGFFVEAGACDGLYLSNTLLLEKQFNWKGICCEPNLYYFNNLQKNRTCFKDNRVLYDSSGEEISFYNAGELGGTKEDFQEEKDRLQSRLSSNSTKLLTISLNDLLKSYNAPKIIDYISLDTEGSELRILKAFNFDLWDVRIFSIEHNTVVRQDNGIYLNSIKEFLFHKGYYFEENQWDSYFYR